MHFTRTSDAFKYALVQRTRYPVPLFSLSCEQEFLAHFRKRFAIMESVIPSTVDPSGFQQKQLQQQQHQLLPNRPLASPQLSQEFVSKSPAPAAPPAPIPSPQRMLSLNDGTLYTRNLLLRGMCLIYLMAFVGFYYQSPGMCCKSHHNSSPPSDRFFRERSFPYD